MKTNCHQFRMSPAALAVRALLIGAVSLPYAAAHAEGSGDASVDELTKPTQSVQVGGIGVSRDAIKANEYDGLQRQGLYGNLGFDLRGGGDYDSADPTRWRFSAKDLGLETRSLQMEYGQQGRFRLSAGFDELIRSGSAVYQSISTPFQGVGSTNLTLPSNWSAPMWASSATMATGSATVFPAPANSYLGLAATGAGSPLVSGSSFICLGSAAGISANCAANGSLGGAYTRGFPTTGTAGAAYANMMAQNLTDLNDFQSVRLSTRRDKEKYAASYLFDSRWTVDVSMQREAKNGIKPLGVVNSATGASASTSVGATGGENSVIIPEVINTLTDTYTVTLNFKGEKAYAALNYFGEMFTNNVSAMTVANPWGVNNTAYNLGGASPGYTTLSTPSTAYGVSSATISEEPSNTFNQLRLNGGYEFVKGTKLTADVAYGRNAQNDNYVKDPAIFSTATGLTGAATNNGSYVPVNSANAVVVTKSFDLKLTSRPISKLTLDAAYKYDLRDNQTPVNTYMWYDAGAKESGAASGTLNGATIPGIASGTPIYSGVNIVANRPYSKRVNQIDLGAEYKFTRSQTLSAGYEYQNVDRWCNGTWIDCSFADSAKESTGKIDYRFVPSETLRGRVGVDVGTRHVDYNANAWMALAPALQATNIASLNTGAIGYSGSVYNFLMANGLSPYGLPIAANASSGYAGQTLAVYQSLFGTGNGGLSNAYYGINNITQNWPGLNMYNMANRNRDRLRGSLDWQASDTFSVQSSADYRRDHYPDNTYGLQNSRSWSWNFDGDFQASSTLTISGFYTHEDQRNDTAGNSAGNGTVGAVTSTVAQGGTKDSLTSPATYNTGVSGGCLSVASNAGLPTGYTPYQLYQNNLKIAPCTQWQSQTHDRADTIGLALTKARLLSERFTLKADLSLTRSVAANSMTGGNYVANPLAAYVVGAPAVYYVNATALPDVTVTDLQLHLTGDYRVSRNGTVRVSYGFTRLQTDDYTYQSTQALYTSSQVMPVMAQSPTYSVSVVGISYTLKVQ